MSTRTYSEMCQFESFEDRFEYLALQGRVGHATFGFDRHMNQRFYTSMEWRNLRHFVITRDLGCDLGIDGYEIFDKIIIHHMNPMVREDIMHGNYDILDPEFLITTTHKTHNAIHYGDKNQLPRRLADRAPGDTRLW